MCVVPTLGPATFEKSTFTSARGVPQLFVRVALTVAVHCVDSFVPGGQAALSIPPVLRTCPVSANVVVTPFTVTSIWGIILEFVHIPVQSLLFGPTSEVSNCPFVVQPPSAPLAVCVTMSSPPNGNAILDGQRLKVHVSIRTTTALTVSGPPVLFTIRTAPASMIGQPGHPLKITPGEPSHGTGKFTGFGCSRS